MKRYFVYACEQIYGGLHGIEDFGVFEFDNSWTEEEIYREYVCEMSRGVMESYGDIMEDLEDSLDRDDYDSEDEYYDAFEGIIEENIDGYVVKIKDNVELSIGNLNKEACRLGADLFKKAYCEVG